jgi:argininosuccinate lyase
MSYPEAVFKKHRFCPGVDQADELMGIIPNLNSSLGSLKELQTKFGVEMDQAWIVCLVKAEILEKAKAKEILNELAKTEPNWSYDGEKNLTWRLGVDEDIASVINYGRTMQEPMSRLQLRHMTNRAIDNIISLLETLLETIEKNIYTIMPGHTHLSHAQPITLAHYFFSIFDGLERALRQLELAYKDTNRNTGGCGACSGTLWSIDRNYLTELLGFDETVEPTYDCEASQDHSMSIMFALSNIALLLSKSSMDMNIWGMEEVDMLKTSYSWSGCSSLMPQKCIPGSQFERTRIQACRVFGEMMNGLTLSKGEPHADMLPICQVWGSSIRAILHAEASMAYYNGMLRNILPQKENMLKYVREGFSCATELVVHMVKSLNYGGRRAHRIVATFVRMAKEKGIKACDTTSALLDAAAEFAEEKPPGIATEAIRTLLDPEAFIANHSNLGGTSPDEAQRMLEIRRSALQLINQVHLNRKAKVERGRKILLEEIEKLIN